MSDIFEGVFKSRGDGYDKGEIILTSMMGVALGATFISASGPIGIVVMGAVLIVICVGGLVLVGGLELYDWYEKNKNSQNLAQQQDELVSEGVALVSSRKEILDRLSASQPSEGIKEKRSAEDMPQRASASDSIKGSAQANPSQSFACKFGATLRKRLQGLCESQQDDDHVYVRVIR